MDETGMPIQKATTLLTKGIHLEHGLRQCRGENKCSEHGVLQGRVGNIHRTALAAVYPWVFCLALLLDISMHINHSAATNLIKSNLEIFDKSDTDFVGWSCERCKHGATKKLADGSSVETPPHTRARGCRYNPDRVGVPPGGVPLPGEAAPAPAAGPAAAAAPAVEPPPGLEAPAGPLLPDAAAAAAPPDPGPPAEAAVDSLPPPPPAPVGQPRRRILKKRMDPKALDPVDEAKVVELPDYIEPSFDFTKIRARLNNPEVKTGEKERIVLGIHIKFWHSPRDDMLRFLRRGGFGTEILTIVVRVIPWKGEDCMKWRRHQTRPQHGMTTSPHFKFRVQTDLWFIWDMTFVIFVDECISYGLTTKLERKTADEWMKTAFHLWIKYFGPICWLVSDQEGAVVSDLVSKACEHFLSIEI